MGNSIVRKISTKVVVGNIGDMVKKGKITEKTAVMRVFGIASGLKKGESNYGEYTAFLGQFRAVNLASGEVFSAGKCFLPVCAQELIEANIGPDSRVEFALDIEVVPDDTVQVGYFYSAAPILEPSENDPLELLASKIESVAALPAPDSPSPKKRAKQ